MSMNYQKIYDNLVSRAKIRILYELYETHHIIPKCLGGTNNAENLVKLTPEEHYLAHQLLAKLYPENYKLTYAAIMMCSNRPSNKLYGWLRRRLSILQSIKMKNGGNPTIDKRWVSNELESKLIHKDEATKLINDGSYIAGKVAKRVECGHLVKKRCVECENLKRKSFDDKKDNTKKMAMSLYSDFLKSEHGSITQFAKENKTSQPRLSILWKKYVPEYLTNRRHGKSFKS